MLIVDDKYLQNIRPKYFFVPSSCLKSQYFGLSKSTIRKMQKKKMVQSKAST